MTHIPKSFYLTFAIIGTIGPWAFFAHFFMQEGFDLVLFIQSLFVNGAASGFSLDVLLSMLVFWIWSYADAQQTQTPRWWLVLPAGCTVGLSLALPLYLYLRNDGYGK